jgi:hypothetical protein
VPLVKAIRRATEIVAECPVGGVCSRRQAGRAVIWTCCGYYRGTHTDSRGLLAKCDFNEKRK